MPDTNPSPSNPPDQRKLMEEKRKQWDAITQKRMEMIAAEKQKQKDREAEETARAARESGAFYAEVAEAKARSADREEWRQGQHEKRREEEKQRQAAAAEKLRLAGEEKKRDAEKAERAKYLLDLHKVAVAHHIRDKRASIEDEAARQLKSAADMTERTLKQLDEERARALHNLESVTARKIAQIKSDGERKKKMIDGKQCPVSEKNRDLLLLEETMQTQIFSAQEEAKHLKDEILKNAAARKALAERQEHRKEQEIERRKENFEKWLKEG